jgi:hypothetical protein
MLPGVPARDTYHAHVVDALVRDGWAITHDPLAIRIGTKDVFIDLGAERFLAAEKGERKIAVEVKSFVGASEVRELEITRGQFLLYGDALARKEPSTSPCASRCTATSFRTRWGPWSWRTGGCASWCSIPTGERWIQRDGTEDAIADELVSAGIPRSRIVLGFWDEEARKLGDFAAA